MSRRSAPGLRTRLVTTFAVVAATASLAVAGISYTVVRNVTLRRALDVAVVEARVHLADAAATLSTAPDDAAIRRFIDRAAARGRAEVVARHDGVSQTTSISFTTSSIPTGVRAAVRDGRVAAQRVEQGDDVVAVVGGAVQPDGPAFYFFSQQTEVIDDLALLARVLAVTSGILVVLSVVVGSVAASGALRPIRRTRAAVREVAAGNLDTTLPVEGSDELAELAEAFNTMTDALRRTVGDLRELESTQRRFVSDVAHELRTPLTALTTACEVLQGNVDTLRPPGRRAAALVLTESYRLAALVEDLLEMSRMDAGAAEVTLDRVDIVRAVEGAIRVRGWADEVAVQAVDRPITFMDARRLDAIVGNLVANARTHGAPPVVATVRSTDGDVRIEIADAGDGIPQRDLGHLFDRFYKADRSRTSGGTGLGLAIARENARLHGGDITVDSVPGRGTTFTVRLPGGMP